MKEYIKKIDEQIAFCDKMKEQYFDEMLKTPELFEAKNSMREYYFAKGEGLRWAKAELLRGVA